jgi:hypothetical protein
MKKQQKQSLRNLILSLALVLALAACGGRGNAEPTEDPNAAVTHVVETAMAAITQTAAVQSPTPSSTPTPEATNTPTPSPTAQLSPTIPSIPTSTSVFTQPGGTTSSCDIGNFVKDVTIPDGTAVAAGSKFTKTWEIKNGGTCTWNEDYVVIFYGGEQMAEKTSYPLTTKDIEPGQSVQISIDMTAPSKTGSFTSYWILRNDAGQNFFVDGGSFYVQISVGGTATPGPSATTDPNQAPSVTISANTTTSITVGGTVEFTGIASDPEDGNLTSSIKWFIGSTEQTSVGGSATLTFNSAGTFTVTAKVTDPDGKTSTSNSISVTVTE